MAIPKQTALFWAAMKLVDGGDTMQLDAEHVRAASERRRKLSRMPGISLITGKAHSGVFISERTATLGDGHRIGLRIYRPQGALGVALPLIMNFHGGGWVSGDPYQSEWWCSNVAHDVQAVVVSVDYRLAPENPWPAAPEDCYDATAWAVEHATELGVDGSRLAVMGDSAGGNLAAVVSLMARDRGGPDIALQLLLYPGVELIKQFASADENEFAPVLGKADLDVWRLYCTEDQAEDPYASPLRADHEGVAPAFVQTAQHDPLRDQGLAYVEALRAAGVPVKHTNYIDAVHGYISLPGIVPVARQAEHDAATALAEALA